MDHSLTVEVELRTLDNFLYVITRGSKWSQITDRNYVSAWTSGDWEDFYYVFTNGNGLRLEFSNCNKKTWIGLFRPEESLWSCIYEVTVDKLSLIQLRKILDKFDIIIADEEVYGKN